MSEPLPLVPEPNVGVRLHVLLIENATSADASLRGVSDDPPDSALRVAHARSLRDALGKLRDSRFDAIVTDLNVPDCNGLEILRALAAAAPEVPLIALVERDGDLAACDLLKCGAQDSLVKGRGDSALILKTIRYAVERKASERYCSFLSHYDRLTGLANRELFHDRLRQALSRAERTGRQVALLFLDLDRFKSVNDTLGHRAGDALLSEVAQRLKTCIRKSDTIARPGGDEFAIVLEGIDARVDAEVVCRKIIKSLEAPLLLQQREIYVTASIGVTFYPSDDTELDALLRNADAAMYRAKEEGRNKFYLFTADLNARTAKRISIESALRHAVDRQEFSVVYQPKIAVQTGEVLGAEALLRWENPRCGPVPPADFIPIAEETGLIVRIGAWILNRACSDARKWQAAGFDSVSVAVNLSARQFRQGGLLETTREALRESGIAPRRLEFEITESLLMDDTDASQVALNELKALGVSIYLDDFGTGYSSLAYLKKFPIDGLKIDRSFIRDLPANADDAAITHAILALSQALRLKVVAEGVENEGQLSFLRQIGCNVAQGYYFGRPLPFEEFLGWLQRRPSLHRQLPF